MFEFDIFEGGVSTATSKTAFWWSLVSSTRVKNDGDWLKRPDFSFFFCFFSEFQGISCFPIEKYLVLRFCIMKNIAPNIIEEMSGNSICQESPGKHPGNTRERSIY